MASSLDEISTLGVVPSIRHTNEPVYSYPTSRRPATELDHVEENSMREQPRKVFVELCSIIHRSQRSCLRMLSRELEMFHLTSGAPAESLGTPPPSTHLWFELRRATGKQKDGAWWYRREVGGSGRHREAALLAHPPPATGIDIWVTAANDSHPPRDQLRV